MRKGFTMVELVFVIVIIGILAAVALPKFSETSDQAQLAKAITVLNNVRTALVTESQKRALSGDDTAITSLSDGGTGKIFDKFNADGDGNKNDILLYPLDPCNDEGCWSGSGSSFTYHLPGGGSCSFTLSNDKFTGSCPKLKS